MCKLQKFTWLLLAISCFSKTIFACDENQDAHSGSLNTVLIDHPELNAFLKNPLSPQQKFTIIDKKEHSLASQLQGVMSAFAEVNSMKEKSGYQDKQHNARRDNAQDIETAMRNSANLLAKVASGLSDPHNEAKIAAEKIRLYLTALNLLHVPSNNEDEQMLNQFTQYETMTRATEICDLIIREFNYKPDIFLTKTPTKYLDCNQLKVHSLVLQMRTYKVHCLSIALKATNLEQIPPSEIPLSEEGNCLEENGKRARITFDLAINLFEEAEKIEQKYLQIVRTERDSALKREAFHGAAHISQYLKPLPDIIQKIENYLVGSDEVRAHSFLERQKSIDLVNFYETQALNVGKLSRLINVSHS